MSEQVKRHEPDRASQAGQAHDTVHKFGREVREELARGLGLDDSNQGRTISSRCSMVKNVYCCDLLASASFLSPMCASSTCGRACVSVHVSVQARACNRNKL